LKNNILGLILVQLIGLYFSIKFNLILLFIIPLAFFFLIILLIRPHITLLLISFITLIKGYLIEQFSFFENLDLTVLLILILWASFILFFFQGKLSIPKWSIKILFTFFIFVIFLFFSGFYSPSPEYGWMKIFRYITFTSSIFIAPIILFKDKNDSILMLNYFKIISLVVLVGMLGNLFYLFVKGELVTYLVRATILGANPIAVSRTLAIIAAMVTIIGIRQNGMKQFFFIVLLIPILIAIVSTGSRGPLVSFFLGMIVFTFLFESNSYKNKLLSSGLISLIIASILIFILPESLTSRFLQLTQGDQILTSTGVEQISTINTRFNFWILSIDNWLRDFKTFFIGIGSGGFSSFFIWRDFRWYPHNFFLEILVEQGIIGISLIFCLIYFSLKQFLNFKKLRDLSEHSAIWISGTLVLFFSAQFSGDLNDNRILFMFLAISLSSINLDKNAKVKTIA